MDPTTEQPLASSTHMNEPPLGFVGKLWNLFVDPRKTFKNVGRSHE